MGEVFRRICVLRSQGRAGEAQQLEDTEFAAAAALAAAGTPLEAEATLQRVIAEEAAGVAQALAVAEILIPRLLEGLGAVPRLRLSPAPGAPRARAAAPAEARGIADFIDEMLSQERRAPA